MDANISLKQLRAFLAVASTGSFTAAAAELNVTQSTLSLLIKGLEAEIGFKVLDRTTRKVTVSEAGKHLQPMAKTAIDGLDSVIRGASEVASVQRGQVRIAGTEMIANTLVAPAIAAYQKHRPGVDVKFLDTTTYSMLDTLRNGDVEFVIGPATFGVSGLDSNITATPLFFSTISAFCPRGHPLARRSSIGWTELTRHPLIVHSFDFSSWLVPRLREHSDASAHDLTSFVEARQVSSIFAGFSLASAGLGAVIAPTYLGTLARKLGLSGPRLTRPTLQRVIAVYTRRNHALSPAAQDLLAFIQKLSSTLMLTKSH